MSTPNPFWLTYQITRTPLDQIRIGGSGILVAEARAFNPPADKYKRSDTPYTGNFESTLLDAWEEIQITVINVLNGQRDETDINNLSKHMDFKECFQSMADGQQCTLDASNIGGIDRIYQVKLLTPSAQLVRKKQYMKYDATFTLKVVN